MSRSGYFFPSSSPFGGSKHASRNLVMGEVIEIEEYVLEILCESYAENDIGKSEYRVICEVVLDSRCGVTMSSTQRSGKAVASSSRKRVRTGTTIPPALAVPRGQTQRYKAKAFTSEGKKWYKSHMEAKFFLDVTLDDVHLEREATYGFHLSRSSECNVSVVREFYSNWKPNARSHFVTVQGVEVSLTPSTINQILGTVDAPFDVLTGINISPPYQQIRHSLCGAHYHQSYPYAHINREARVWLKIVMNCLIPGLHFTEVMRDRVCLVYALMKDLPINIGAVLKSSMRKARVHRGRRYTFGGLITNLCKRAGVPEESVDYMAPLFTTPLDVTKTKGPENMHGPTLTTTKRNMRDDMITMLMFGLEMLRHRNGCRASNDVPTDKDKWRTMFYSESDSDADEGDLLALEGIGGDADMDE
ncbi:hypothetical protein H5410_026781 [Solanum commersonii]|uniref:Putative plant transposon protein domain-containing protein n=1 Tax=Solanum commersonii TaxID=4109 RepID=A0A9J5YXH1_SOLCO|nr:hypothetical protein H5410_026781 [Solanum commersonii]